MNQYQLLSGELVDLEQLSKEDLAYLLDLQRRAMDAGDYFDLLRRLCGADAYPLKGSDRVTHEICESLLYRIAKDIVERVGIEQGTVAPTHVAQAGRSRTRTASLAERLRDLRSAVIAGADGCPKGWFCLRMQVPSGRIHGAVFETAGDLLKQTPRVDVLAVDIPIGLPDSGPREADREARSVLGPRASSVFPAPIRPALDAASYEEACEITEGVDGRRVSKQAWAICAKVAAVDAVLRDEPDLREIVREVHPEVSFWAWNDKEPLRFAKKKRKGKEERRQLVDSAFGEEAFASVRADVQRGDVADDDILDAFAALWTALRIVRGSEARLPEDPPEDAVGLRMEIVY